MLKTLVTAMMPILEIRGAIPVGVASGLDPWLAFAVGFVGNMLPIPILILLTRKIIEWLKSIICSLSSPHGLKIRAQRVRKRCRSIAFGDFLSSLRYRFRAPVHGRAHWSPRFWICA